MSEADTIEKNADAGTDIQQRSAMDVAPLSKNPFEEFGEQAQRNIVGKLLKFNKGDYYVGQDGDELPRGTRLVAIMDQLTRGWIRWADGKPEQQILGLVAEGFKPPKRDTLGDDDKELWETDREGRPMDPWQPTMYLLMKDPGKPAADDTLYTFASGSKGAEQALQGLALAYGKRMREYPDEYPIVTLDYESYKHEDWGIIKKPKIEIVGWESKELSQNSESAPAEAADQTKTAAPRKAGGKK